MGLEHRSWKDFSLISTKKSWYLVGLTTHPKTQWVYFLNIFYRRPKIPQICLAKIRVTFVKLLIIRRGSQCHFCFCFCSQRLRRFLKQNSLPILDFCTFYKNWRDLITKLICWYHEKKGCHLFDKLQSFIKLPYIVYL